MTNILWKSIGTMWIYNIENYYKTFKTLMTKVKSEIKNQNIIFTKKTTKGKYVAQTTFISPWLTAQIKKSSLLIFLIYNHEIIVEW